MAKGSFWKFLKALARESIEFAISITLNVIEISKRIVASIPSAANSLRNLMGSFKHYTEKVISATKKVLYFGKLKMQEFLHRLRIGEIKDAFKTSINKKLRAVEERSLKADVVPLPTARLHDIETRLTNLENDVLARDLKKATTAAEIQSALDKSLNFNEKFKISRVNRYLGYVSSTLVLAGIPITGLLVYQHQQKMSKCIRIEYKEDGQTVRCFINQHTCGYEPESNYCSRELLLTDVDGDESALKTCGNITKGCVSCNSADNDPFIENPNVVWRCQTPDFWEAFGDMFHDVVDEIVTTSEKVVSSIFGPLLKILFPILIVVVGVIVGSIVIRQFLSWRSTQQFNKKIQQLEYETLQNRARG